MIPPNTEACRRQCQFRYCAEVNVCHYEMCGFITAPEPPKPVQPNAGMLTCSGCGGTYIDAPGNFCSRCC